MLNSQIFVNLSLKVGVGMDFIRHGNSSVIGSTQMRFTFTTQAIYRSRIAAMVRAQDF
jgi:hypothetical protein